MATAILSLSRSVVCIAENRASCEPALRILVASISKNCGNVSICLFCPNASRAFRTWLSKYPDCYLNPCELDGVWTKYDIKPLALISLLRLGIQEVIWVDSDIVVTKDFGVLMRDMPPETLGVSEEALGGGRADPDGLRARLWSMPVGRVLPFATNTAIIRATQSHSALLLAWHDLLQSDEYRAAQDRAWYEREVHVAGDQEVLTALLASKRFADIPIAFLRRGRDIIQFFGPLGYTTAERWRHLTGQTPFFVHSQGFRPWWPEPPPRSGYGARFAYLYNALSPYTVLARRYAGVLEDTEWLRPPTRLARLLTSRHPALCGLPLAVVVDMRRLKRAVAGWLRATRPRTTPTLTEVDARMAQ